jgi:hypothetical protein
MLSELNRKLGLTDEILRHTLLVRPHGALEKKFEISAYVAPLSEEAKREREPSSYRVSRATDSDEEERERPIFKKIPPRPVAPSVAMTPQAPPMTMEELDEKLDKILEGDIADNL